MTNNLAGRGIGPFIRRWNLLLAVALRAVFSGCSVTTHPAEPAKFGHERRLSDLEAVMDTPGTLTVTTVNSADWAVDLSGLLNLDHTKAKAAGIEDRLEPISIYFHVIQHPEQGLYLVDTGVETKLRTAPSESAMSWLVRSAMHMDRLKVRMDLGSYLAQQRQPLKGVFLTHLHLDHVSGLPDVPNEVPVFVGEGETKDRHLLNLFDRSSIDAELNGKRPLRELAVRGELASGGGVLDVFGDGQLWALAAPGHTRGSLAFVARTPAGPVLMTGDASHTAWGWNNGVEPGSFSADKPASAVSLGQLRALAERHPRMSVRLGHQSLESGTGAKRLAERH